MHMILYGTLQSKSNSRKAIINRRTGKMMFIKSKAALECVMSFHTQVKAQWKKPTLTGPVNLQATVYYPSRRSDLDISLLMDILQKAEVYANDRQVISITAEKKLDPENPRSEERRVGKECRS